MIVVRFIEGTCAAGTYFCAGETAGLDEDVALGLLAAHRIAPSAELSALLAARSPAPAPALQDAKPAMTEAEALADLERRVNESAAGAIADARPAFVNKRGRRALG